MKTFPPFVLLLNLFVWFGPVAVRAQSNFRPGYVVPLTGDTLRGEVDSRDNRLNERQCRFRLQTDGTITIYFPNEVKAYGLSVDNRHFRSIVVAKPSTGSKPYFLELLVDGPACLYFLRDDEQKEFFCIVSPKLPFSLLEHNKVLVERDGRSYLEEQRTYRNLLALAFAGCEPAQKQLPSLPYQEKALRRIVATYNTECAGYREVSAQAGTSVFRATWGVMGGVVQHSLKYRGFPYSYNEMTTRQHTGFVVGPVLELSSKRFSQRLSLVLALLYEPETYDLQLGGNGFGAIRHHFGLNYLRLPVMLKYTYPRGRVAPVAEIGATAAYSVADNNRAEQTDFNGNYVPAGPYIAGVTRGDAFQPMQFGLGGGLGICIRLAGARALTLLARIENASGFSASPAIYSNVTHYYGLLSFDLTK